MRTFLNNNCIGKKPSFDVVSPLNKPLYPIKAHSFLVQTLKFVLAISVEPHKGKNNWLGGIKGVGSENFDIRFLLMRIH